MTKKSSSNGSHDQKNPTNNDLNAEVDDIVAGVEQEMEAVKAGKDAKHPKKSSTRKTKNTSTDVG